MAGDRAVVSEEFSVVRYCPAGRLLSRIEQSPGRWVHAGDGSTCEHTEQADLEQAKAVGDLWPEPPLDATSRLACPACRGGDFSLLAAGRIACADEDCGATFPARWAG